VNGECVFTPKDCDDGDPCTTDFCDGQGNCQSLPISCDPDGDPCTIARCVDGECVSEPACDDGDPCTEDFCVPVGPQLRGNDEGPFECMSLPIDCDDSDPCTADECVAGECRHTPINDFDGDGVGEACDNCPQNHNPDQADGDGDGLGDACDPTPRTPPDCNDNGIDDGDEPDGDGDGVIDVCDNCVQVSNPDQADSDGDGIGNACDPTPQTPPGTQPTGSADGDSDCGAGLCGFGSLGFLPCMILGLGLMKPVWRRRRA
jgi:hypothetical protein